jgi:mono/diheme cytochrome c family protein
MMPRAMSRRRRVLAAGFILAAGLGAAACGSEGISTTVEKDRANIKRGAELFAERCAGCHTMDVAGGQGGATKVHDRERVDGPNFNVRKEDRDSVLYAIRNGGFSGAIMPENLVVGQEAEDVAAFLEKYAGGGGGAEAAQQAQQPSGGGESTTGTETTPSAGTESTPGAATGGGDEQAAAQGKQIFTQNCAGCHTLSDAGASGQVGPNLDDAKPDEQAVQGKVKAGGGGMPAFEGILQDDEITAVAQYVSSVAGQ